MVLMPGFQSTQLATEGALEPFFFLYTDDSIQGNPETCKQSSIMLNYEVKNTIARRYPQVDNQSIQHTRWNCTYHIVFIPKYRRKVMYGEVKRDVVEV